MPSGTVIAGCLERLNAKVQGAQSFQRARRGSTVGAFGKRRPGGNRRAERQIVALVKPCHGVGDRDAGGFGPEIVHRRHCALGGRDYSQARINQAALLLREAFDKAC